MAKDVNITYMAKDVKLRLLIWGDYPELSKGTLNIITSTLIRGRQREILLYKRGDVTEAETFEDSMLLAFKMEEEAIN